MLVLDEETDNEKRSYKQSRTNEEGLNQLLKEATTEQDTGVD